MNRRLYRERREEILRLFKHQVAIVLLVLSGIMSVHAADVKTLLSATDIGRIHFMSANGNTTFRQMYQKTVIFNDTVSGELRFPATMKAGQKVAAMVIMHASAGVTESEYAWAQFFNDMGMATFVVDSFTPRGISRTVEDQTLLNFAASTADALKALALLATDPLIDAKRIGVIGFSRGGNAALNASFVKMRAAVIQDDSQFAAHFIFYASCSEYAKTTGAPLRIFFGSKDSYNTVAACQNNVAALKSTGADVEMTVYDGARHGFDTAAPPNLWVPRGVTGKDCMPGSVNLDTAQAVLIDGTHLSALDFYGNRKACTKIGLDVGGSPKYRDMSRAAIKAFLSKQFDL